MITKTERIEARQATDELAEAQARHNEGMATPPKPIFITVSTELLCELVEGFHNRMQGQQVIVTNLDDRKDGTFVFRAERKI